MEPSLTVPDATSPSNVGSCLTIATLAVGDEVLRGEVINSNASWLAQSILGMGAQPTGHFTVGDTPSAIVQACLHAFHQADVVIITGGLGPTQDDLTLASLAESWNLPMCEHSDVIVAMVQRFQALGKDMPPQNRKQALLPQGAIALANPVGTAPGMWLETHHVPALQAMPLKLVIALPGVPREMKALWPDMQTRLLAWATDNQYTVVPSYTKDLWFYGIGESHLVQAMGDRMASLDPAVAPYVSDDGRVRLRLSLQRSGVSSSEAERVFARFKNELPAPVNPYLLDDGCATLAQNIMHCLKQVGWRIAMAESCTGGALAHAFIQEAGASAFVETGIIAYANETKTTLCSVPSETLLQHGAVSEPVACAMARGIQARTSQPGNTLGLATTGIAGPEGGSPEKPVGTLWVGLALPDGTTQATCVQVNPLLAACHFALNVLRGENECVENSLAHF
jgi:nicotinamide-nucleotide amidase